MTTTIPAAMEAQASVLALAADSAVARGDHERAAEYLTRAHQLNPLPIYLERLHVLQDLEHPAVCDCADCSMAEADDADSHTDYMAGVI